ncbi:MAG TPA: YfhO family protein [Lunatimonas sp.]|nr:YfhO family protein [Lunatimonas sp.]
MPFDFKKALPHLLGILSFYLVTVLYFSPVVFDGKMMFQSDILQWEGSAKEILDYREQTGDEALWTNRMFGGMPAYLIHSLPKGDLTNTLVQVLTVGLPHPINALFFGMISMYLLLITFGIRPAISIAGSYAFAFNTFNLLSMEAGHNAKIWSICLIPLILAGIHLAFSRKILIGVSIAALAVLLQLKYNHLQITYYTLIIIAFYGIGQLVLFYKDKKLPEFGKISALLLLGALLGVLGNSARLGSVIEYGKYSIRGERNLETAENGQQGLDKEYAFNWSQGKLETFTLLIPNFYGGASSQSLPKNSSSEEALRSQGVEGAQINEFLQNAPTYWGDQPGTGGPIYGGAVMLFLFVIGLIYAQPFYRNILLGIVLFSLILAWGKNLAWLNYFLFDYLPGYNKFRAVSMALGITLFAVPVLGCLGLERFVVEKKSAQKQKSFLISLGVTMGLLLVGIVAAGWMGYRGNAEGGYPDWLQNALRTDRQAMLQSDALRSFLFIAVAAGLLFAYLRDMLHVNYALLGVALLVIVDVWGVNKRYLNNDSFVTNPSNQYFAANPADQKISADDGYFRVLNIQNPFNEARTSYRFNSVGGYHGAKMSRYQDLIERNLSPEISQFIQKAQEGNFDWESIQNLNMLNTKYLLAGNSENAVFQNPNANGPAWLPEEVLPVTTNLEEIETLGKINTKKSATLNTVEFSNVAAGQGSVSLYSYEPNKITYTANLTTAGLAVFSEIFYPKGWSATINGSAADILRVNYLLRGLNLPQGESSITFEFRPKSYLNMVTFMIIAQYALLILLAISLFYTLKPNK